MSKNTRNVKASKHISLGFVIIVAAIIGAVAIFDIQTGEAAVKNTVEVGQTQRVLWTAKSINAGTVSVNLIKKVSDNPAKYVLVRTISNAKTNNGRATWVPASTDVGTGLSLEVGCVPSTKACVALENHTSDLSVVTSNRFANTAAAFQAIEAQGNR